MPRLSNTAQKPLVFISHIHEEEPSANALEKVLRRALLGALDVFNQTEVDRCRRSLEGADYRNTQTGHFCPGDRLAKQRCEQLGELRNWWSMGFRNSSRCVLYQRDEAIEPARSLQ